MVHAPSLAVMIVLLIIVVLLFGQGKVAGIAGELGSAIREFKKGLEGNTDEKEAKPAPTEPQAAAQPELPPPAAMSEPTKTEAPQPETSVPTP